MTISLEEVKEFLRVDTEHEDRMIQSLIDASTQLIRDVLRTEDDSVLDHNKDIIRVAIYYATAYLYEHREEANHHQLTLTLRNLLFGVRKVVF